MLRTGTAGTVRDDRVLHFIAVYLKLNNVLKFSIKLESLLYKATVDIMAPILFTSCVSCSANCSCNRVLSSLRWFISALRPKSFRRCENSSAAELQQAYYAESCGSVLESCGKLFQEYFYYSLVRSPCAQKECYRRRWDVTAPRPCVTRPASQYRKWKREKRISFALKRGKEK